MPKVPFVSEGWHLDKRVPIALIAAIALQSGTAIWWAASVTAGMDSAERDRITIEARLSKIENERDDFRERMLRVEIQLTHLTNTSNEILELLKRREQPYSQQMQ